MLLEDRCSIWFQKVNEDQSLLWSPPICVSIWPGCVIRGFHAREEICSDFSCNLLMLYLVRCVFLVKKEKKKDESIHFTLIIDSFFIFLAQVNTHAPIQTKNLNSFSSIEIDAPVPHHLSSKWIVILDFLLK